MDDALKDAGFETFCVDEEILARVEKYELGNDSGEDVDLKLGKWYYLDERDADYGFCPRGPYDSEEGAIEDIKEAIADMEEETDEECEARESKEQEEIAAKAKELGIEYEERDDQSRPRKDFICWRDGTKDTDIVGIKEHRSLSNAFFSVSNEFFLVSKIVEWKDATPNQRKIASKLVRKRGYIT